LPDPRPGEPPDHLVEGTPVAPGRIALPQARRSRHRSPDLVHAAAPPGNGRTEPVARPSTLSSAGAARGGSSWTRLRPREPTRVDLRAIHNSSAAVHAHHAISRTPAAGISH